MNEKRYFGNIQEIHKIISKLDEGSANPKEAEELYTKGIALLEDCESILGNYIGTIEELKDS